MAGGHGPPPVKIDPNVEAWAAMRENVYKTFKFTSTTTRTSLIWAVAVPVLAYYIVDQGNAKWDWQGKKRSDSLLKESSSSSTHTQSS